MAPRSDGPHGMAGSRKADTDPGSDPAIELDVRQELLVELAADARRGAVRPLEHYLEQFAGQEGLVAEEYRALFEDGASGRRPDHARFGPFRLERHIGGGGQGLVYDAVHVPSGKRVALKLLVPIAAEDRLRRLRFAREAELLREIDHAGVERLLDAGLVDRLPYVATELVEGGTLASWIELRREIRARGGGWPRLAEVLRIGERLARALHAVHQVGIVHRDVKPANVVLDANGSPVLIDFGLARGAAAEEEHLTGSKDLLGTLAYLPPERKEGAVHRWDARSDVYCLGATLFELLTLAPPYRVAREAGRPMRVVPDPRQVRRDLPREVARVVRAAVEPDPERRYATAVDLADDLLRVSQGRRAEAGGPRVLGQLVARLRRHPWSCGAGLAVVLLLVLATGRLLRSRAAESYRWALVRQRALALHMGELERRRDALWPELPRGIPAMDAWIAEARGALEQARGVQQVLLRSSLVGGPALAPLAIDEGLLALEAGLAEVTARRDRAARWASPPGGAAAAAWEGARARVAADPRFAGLELAARPGLQPLGPDPTSGFEEFAHLLTGTAPMRDPRSGTLDPGPETAVVLVLLPGGCFPLREGRLALERGELERPASARADVLTLRPFLISKYELTQGQWLRLAGSNPSRHAPGGDALEPIELTHPVENVSWVMAQRVLARVGLVLPTEAQWEYSARGGTTTRWWCGDEREDLRGRANLADRAAVRAGHSRTAAADWPDLDDGFAWHAAVGTFPANPFGLHEVAGNVWEWCRDAAPGLDARPRDGDGLRPGEAECRVRRGGGIYDPARKLKSAARSWTAAESRTFSLGVRPAMEVLR